MTDVVVYGAGGLGREVAEAVRATADDGGPLRLLGFLDDAAECQGAEVMGLPVLGCAEWISQHADVALVAAIGHPRARYRVIQKSIALGGRWETVIHPAARLSSSAQVGEGAVVLSDAIISAGATVGAFAHVYYLTTVAHDARIGTYACLMPQVAISGTVDVGEGAFIGAGTVTRQGVTIGDWSVVGAGAVVVQAIPPLCVAVGVPASPIRHYASSDEMPAF
jgi:sugar O-acyltransferase (sialic acid O-acetyltransferase NeuD family)